jgi:hypothetical protein
LPAELVLTDVESHLDLLRINAEANAVPGCDVMVEAYEWGKEAPVPGGGGAFDVILGGDLAYNPGLYGPLVGALDACSDAHTLTYLCVTRSDTNRGFFELLYKRGFEYFRIPDWETEGKSEVGDVCSYGLFVIFKERPRF